MIAFVRFARALLGLYLLLGAGCPFRQSDRAPESPAWSEEVFLRVGEEASVDGDALTVALVGLDPGRRLSDVTVRLSGAEGTSITQSIEAVRNARLSEAVRLGPYVIRVRGFPGVDSATLLVTRE